MKKSYVHTTEIRIQIKVFSLEKTPTYPGILHTHYITVCLGCTIDLFRIQAFSCKIEWII